MEELSKGIEFEVGQDKKKLTVIIDISGTGAISGSGKSRVIASTSVMSILKCRIES